MISEYENIVDITFKTSPQPAFNKRIELLNENLNEMWAKGFKINLCYTDESQKERLQQLLSKYRKNYQLKLIKKSLFEGFIDHDEKKIFYSDHQIQFLLDQYWKKKKYLEYFLLMKIHRVHEQNLFL